MKIQNIQFTTASNRTFKGRNSAPEFSSAHSPSLAADYSIHSGMKTAAAWFTFGVGLDYAGRKFTVFKSPLKNSLFINLIIATVAGIYACIKRK